jgi:hypothetical protein
LSTAFTPVQPSIRRIVHFARMQPAAPDGLNGLPFRSPQPMRANFATWAVGSLGSGRR